MIYINDVICFVALPLTLMTPPLLIPRSTYAGTFVVLNLHGITSICFSCWQAPRLVMSALGSSLHQRCGKQQPQKITKALCGLCRNGLIVSHSSYLWMDCFLLARRLGDHNILWWSLTDAKVDIILTYATDSIADSPTQLLRAIRLARLTRMFRAFWRKTGSAHLPNSLRRSWLSYMMLHVQIQICWQIAR